ncbi:MAG: hypothetical protein UU88_C0001G0114 [Parcubacteria group bacterium GW2011_GWC1_42_11]|nr:MAG: hypothetical protein UU88_C0001G0114 [Parcubacteria group bacterium GW2011_GWC1_42_11]KKS58991.1 MAG: hypothetical protein UV24_C0010G0012 [Candidatus Nomurabacteria bacterium GW2011_GWA2_42_41]TAN35916.1 MAG: hypothetical protein EPN27_02680 [Patescibacteria group bacterium]
MAWYNVGAMELSFFNKRKQNEVLAVLIDIGSASVGASLVKIEKDKAPHILANVREDISFQEVLSSARFLFAMNNALEKVLKEIQTSIGQIDLNLEHNKTVSNVFCTLSSPWFILKTRTLDIVREKEFDVTERAIEEFIDKDIEILKDEMKEILPPKDVRIIEKKILQIKLNGYEIKNPYKQKTARVEMSTAIGVSSVKVTKSIERKINNFFHVSSIHFGTFPVAAFSAIRDIFPIEKNFLFLDITGESTDVSLVENDLIIGTISFPLGKNFFIREISTRLNTIHEEAMTLFVMFLRGELHDEQSTQIAGTIADSEKEWLARFEKAIATIAQKGVLPHKIFFTTDSDVMTLFSGLIKKAKSELLADASFDPQYLDQLIVSKFVSFGAGVTRDPFIVVEALLAEKVLGQHI